jgi:O-antigen/teichoic acid export membrane protein
MQFRRFPGVWPIDGSGVCYGMHESMVKFALILIALLALVAGGVLLIIPGWYVELAQIEDTSLAWMRFFGAGLVSVQGFGLLIAAFRRRDTNPLVGLIALASTAEAAVLWYSLLGGEFGSGALWAVVVPGIVAAAGAVLLWGAWLSRRKTLKPLSGPNQQVVEGAPGGAQVGDTQVDEAVGPGQAHAGDQGPAPHAGG